MAKAAPKPKYDHTLTREDCDNYYNTVLAALALINVIRWNEAERKLDPNANFGLGRRMTTSEKNVVSPSTDITPDVVLQRAGKGVLGEITNSLTENDGYWTEKLQQVRKYDDSLLGWWTEDQKLPTHDVVFVVPQSRVVRVSDILTKEKSDEKGIIKFNRPIAVIGFQRHSGAAKEFVDLMKFFGDLSDADLSERLRHGIPVAQGILLKVYGDRKFVDFEPPMPYLLQIMWDAVFPSYLGELPLVADAGDKGRTPVKVELDRIAEDMQNSFGFQTQDARGTAVPARAWVKKALEHLVVFGMASRIDDKTYEVQYRALKGDHVEYFGGQIFKHKGKLDLLGAPLLQPSLPGLETPFPSPLDTASATQDDKAKATLAD